MALLDKREHLEEAAGIKVTLADIITFQEQAAKTFIAHLKENISSRFTSSSDIVSALSIFDHRKAPKVDSPNLPQYGEQALLAHYGAEKPAETLLGETTNGSCHYLRHYLRHYRRVENIQSVVSKQA